MRFYAFHVDRVWSSLSVVLNTKRYVKSTKIKIKMHTVRRGLVHVIERICHISMTCYFSMEIPQTEKNANKSSNDRCILNWMKKKTNNTNHREFYNEIDDL